MTIQTQVVRFQKELTGVANTTQDVNLNFTPKAIIVFSESSTQDNIVQSHYQIGYGFSDGTNHACYAFVSDDNSAAADCAMSTRNDSVFVRMEEDFTTATVLVRGTCAFSTNKVTFTWVTNNTQGIYITVYAFGGSDITNVKVGTTTVGTTSAGTFDYTGLGFNGSAGNSILFTLGTFSTASGEQDFGGIGFGAATSSTQRYYSSCLSENNADPTDTWRNMLSTACFGILNSVGNIADAADFDSWITDGFRLDWLTAPGATTYLLHYMVINGGTWDVGTLDSPASAGSLDTAVSVSSNTIRGLMIAGTGQVTPSTTSSTVNTITVAATDGTTESVAAAIDEDGQTTSDAYRVNAANGTIIRLLGTNAANTVLASFTSFGTNQFTINFTTVSSGTTFGWVVVADSTPAAAVTEEQVYQSYGNLIQVFDSNKNAIFG